MSEAGFLSLFQGTVIIDAMTGEEVHTAVRPQWWVEVTRTLPQGAYEKAQRHIVGDTQLEARGDSGADARYIQTSDILGYQHALVEAALVDWNLTDETGNRLAIANLEDRKRSLAKLPPGVFMGIYSIIAAHNQPRSAAEAATFQAGSGEGDPGRIEADRLGSETGAGDEHLQEVGPDA